MCGIFLFFFKVAELLVHKTKCFCVCKTGAPMLVPADVLTQNNVFALEKASCFAVEQIVSG